MEPAEVKPPIPPMVEETCIGPPAASSFRDPSGFVLAWENRIYRLVNRDGAADLEAFLRSEAAIRFLDDGRVVSSRRMRDSEARDFLSRITGPLPFEAAEVLEHERIQFPSFPYEWPPEMLHAAGTLTLDLAKETLAAGLGLKDATPQNVLFRGPAPVFVDVLSFEKRNPLKRAWLPYAQFVRTFLLPLAANRYFGLSLADMLLKRRDGMEPAEVYRMCGPLRRLLPPFLSLVTLPTWLAGRGEGSAQRETGEARSAEEARFVLNGLFDSLRRTLDRLSPRAGRDSVWADYLDSKSLYSPEQLAIKEQFVRQAVEGIRPEAVLDIGSNEGYFSAICARSGARVVAIDSDPVVAGFLWRKARAEKLNILPLVVDLARPTPAAGWRNLECASFLDRARGNFDMVLMLAVLHHLLVTERIPLADALDLAAELTRKYLLIEYVGTLDPMFRRITRGRDTLHAAFTKDAFEAALRVRFDLLRSVPIGGLDRCLYLARKKA